MHVKSLKRAVTGLSSIFLTCVCVNFQIVISILDGGRGSQGSKATREQK